MSFDNKFKIGQHVITKDGNYQFTISWIRLEEQETNKISYSETKDGKYFPEEDLLPSEGK